MTPARPARPLLRRPRLVPGRRRQARARRVAVPLWASFLTDVVARARAHPALGARGPRTTSAASTSGGAASAAVPFAPWTSRALEPLHGARCPTRRAVAILRLSLEDASGLVLHRNFTAFVVGEGASPRDETRSVDGRSLRVAARRPRPRAAPRSWSLRRLGGDGRGQGERRRLAASFEYRLAWPKDLRPERRGRRHLRGRARGEAALRQGPPDRGKVEGDFMLGSGHPRPWPATRTPTR